MAQRLKKALTLAVAAAALAVGCRWISAGPSPEDLSLTVVGTSDLHGAVSPHRAALGQASPTEQGGLAVFAGYLRAIRDENPGRVLLVDAGDLFQGTLIANLTEGEALVKAYNALGYDAVAVGNHEFDYGPVGPAASARNPRDDPFGALKARIGEATFPFLGRNIYDARSGERPSWLKPGGLHFVDRGGIRVGIVGLATPNTPRTTNPLNVASLRFTPLAEEIHAAARELRERGAEVVVLLVHAGGRCASLVDPHSLQGCELDDEIFQALSTVSVKEVDVVVAGHTHSSIGHFVHGIPVIESLAQGRAFGRVDLFVDSATRRVRPSKTRIASSVPICQEVFEGGGGCDAPSSPRSRLVPASYHGKRVEPDPAIEALIVPYAKQVEALTARRLGVTVPRPLRRFYDRESPLGDTLADAFRRMENADLALVNSGGIRADLSAGDLTYGALYEVQPFDNQLATFRLTGKELQRLLSVGYAGGHGIFQISGMKARIARCDRRQRLVELTHDDGSPLQPERLYRVVTSDFLAMGGDGLAPALAALDQAKIDLGQSREQNMRDELVRYLSRKGGSFEPADVGERIRIEVSPECPVAQGRGEGGMRLDH